MAARKIKPKVKRPHRTIRVEMSGSKGKRVVSEFRIEERDLDDRHKAEEFRSWWDAVRLEVRDWLL